MIPTHPIEADTISDPVNPSSNPLPPDHSDAVPKVLLQEAMKLSYTAKMKMAARLLDSVGTTLRSDCERLRFWIHTRPFEDSLPSVITPRDRQQRDSALRGRTLRLVPTNIDQHKLRPRDEKYATKVRSTKWAIERHKELESIQTLLPKIENLASQTRALLLPTAISTTGGRFSVNMGVLTKRRDQLLAQPPRLVHVSTK